MPRMYKPHPRAKRHLVAPIDELNKAIDEVVFKERSYRKVAKERGINYSVLYRACKKRVKGIPLKRKGGQTALTETEENAIVGCIITASKWGYPIDLFELRCIIHSYLDDIGKKVPQFKDNFPGVDFAYSFVKRHRKEISFRMCENIKRCRARVSREIINDFFDNLETELKDVPPELILNYDETNLSDDPGRKKKLTKRGSKHPERIVNSSKSATSIMYAISASGAVLPPYVVYRAKHLYDTWTTNGPSGTRYNRTLSGWFDAMCFFDWLKSVVIPHFRKFDGKKILIGDNLASHLSFQTVKLCLERDIHFIFLPPNSTHLTQPLDVCYFRPLKYAWTNILDVWKKGAGKWESTVPKSSFPSLLKSLHQRVFEKSEINAQSGFKATGIFPLDREKVLKHVLSSEEVNNSDLEAVALESNFEKFLRKMHFDSSSSTPVPVNTSSTAGDNGDHPVASAEIKTPKPRGRKRKISTQPGKSVCEEDFIDQNKNEARPPPKKRGRKKKNPVSEVSSDVNSESDEVEYEEDFTAENENLPPPKKRGRKKKNPVSEVSSDVNSESDEGLHTEEHPDLDEYVETMVSPSGGFESNERSTEPDIPKPLSLPEMEIGMFIVVRYEYEIPSKKKNKKEVTEERFFVGQIIEIFANRLQVKYLRPHRGSSTTFTYPHVDDIDFVPVSKVVKSLPKPGLFRGTFSFSEAPF